MRIVVATNDQQRDVLVSIDQQSALVEDLVTAVGMPASTMGVDVDGRYVPAATPLREAGLYEGVTVAPAEPHGPAWHRDQPTAWVSVVAGPETGLRRRLDPNQIVVAGRSPDCTLVLASPSVSNRHALVTMAGDGTITVEDTDSRNGTWVDGDSIHDATPVEVGSSIRIGAVVVRIEPPDPDDLPTGDTVPSDLAATSPFNRPPRPALPSGPAPIEVPVRRQSTTARQGFRIAALISPILMGAFMVYRTNPPNFRFAGFAIISPIAFFINWYTTKRRAKKETRRFATSFAAELEGFRDRLVELWHATRHHAEAITPTMTEVSRRCRAPSTRLWERRLGHPDALRLRVGSANLDWEAPVVQPRSDDEQPPEPPEELDALLAEHDTQPTAPVTVDLLERANDEFATLGNRNALTAGVVGIVGDGDPPRALARALLVQATTFHGPADIQVGVFANPQTASAWEWAKWLPHTRLPDGRTRLVSDRLSVSEQLTNALRDGREAVLEDRRNQGGVPGAIPFLVIDDLTLLAGRSASARQLLSGATGLVTGIVVAPTVDQLPAACTIVVVLGSDGSVAEVVWPALARRIGDVIPAGITTRMAQRAAQDMARWDDPELAAAGGSVPDLVRLLPLLDMDDVTAATVTARWKEAGRDPGTPCAIGADGTGRVDLDLRTDGPHGLVGGTTGSGKSELLRSMIASMAAQVDPDHLVFVLVDYKGGSAFDLCAQLPHTVGMVTDLDEHLGQRALVSLEAELHHREVVLRDAGAQDLPDYLSLGSPAGPMPRLVVVIDEFATMATELPDFLGALVGIAQRGRSLGVHLILATQRPRGAVNANIRANTNLRIALRVQDPGDSTDIIDVPDAANLPRERPGRAWIRRGHGDLVLVQSALSTAGAPADADPMRVVPFRFTPDSPLPSPSTSGPSDLSRLVTACRQAFANSGAEPPRRPWLPMPVERIELSALLEDPRAADVVVPFGLEDVPELQAQRPYGWPMADGHLSLVGMVGQGTTTALQSVATSIAATIGPEECHLYGIDFGGGSLAVLGSLPHTGAIVESSNTERQARLVSMLNDEVALRRSLTARQRDGLPRIVVVIDKIAGFMAEHDNIESRSIGDQFTRVFKEGPAVGIVMALTSEQARDLPTRMRSSIATTLQFKVADSSGLGFSATKDMPDLSPGRAWDAVNAHVVQVGLPLDPTSLADRWPAATTHAPDPIGLLPDEFTVDRIPAGRHESGPLQVPIGVRGEDLGTAHLVVYPGDHVAIAGPARAGKSSLLMTISSQLRTMLPDAIQLAVCDPARSPLAGWASLDGHGTPPDLQRYLELGMTAGGNWFIFVDDLGQYANDATITELLSARPDLHVIAAGRPGDLRGSYGGWARQLRQGRTGVLLEPELPTDGDLLSTKLPRRITTPLMPGRGFVVNGGDHGLAHMALPPDTPPPGGLAAA